MHTKKTTHQPTATSPATFQQAFQLHQQGQLEQAEVLYEELLKTQPQHIDALHFLGVLANQRGQAQRAVDLIRLSLAINADNAAAQSNLGLALHELKHFDEAIASYDRALAINPNNADAYFNRGHALRELKRFPEAIACYERALAIKPNLDFILGTWLYLKMNLCAWDGFDEQLNALTQGIEHGEKTVVPFSLLAMSSSVAVQKQAADIYTAAKHPTATRLPLPAKHSHAKIKIGYFSSDFRQHPVAYLAAELFERHDRSQFEVIAFSFHATDVKDAMRLRLEAAFDKFIDVSQQSNEQIVNLARELEIDIAIDLNGCTDGCRTGIFAMRAAPVQATYLGYSGTMGADYIDYLIADSVLIPDEYQTYYTEKVVYLPHSYMVNDTVNRPISDRPMTRSEFGLPEQGVVFCCFNNHYKITPAVFASWMRVLQRVTDSVLWLSAGNADIVCNLQREAAAHGVDANRLIFAQRLASSAEHLARHRLADLFLDTAPYNAHTTSSDALWAGLPVLTCVGEAAASRVAASLLNAIGLPELITTCSEDYEALAIQLATHPEQLAALKQKLAANRLTYPLFDTVLFTQHIESAYQTMFDRYQADLAPDHIYVAAQNPAVESPQPSTADKFQHAFSLHQQGQLAKAADRYEDILRTEPHHIDVLHFLGVLCNQRGQAQRAVELICQSLAINPNNAGAHSNLGLALHALKRFNEAIVSFDRALAIKPNHAETLSNQGNVLQELTRYDDALANYERALAINPDCVDALYNRGIVLQVLHRFDEALSDYQQVLAISPEYEFLFGTWLHLKMNICDWRDLNSQFKQLVNGIEQGKKISIPFTVLAISDSLALQKKSAEIYTQAKHPSNFLAPALIKHAHSKIRIGYFSGDFGQHPVSYLMAELFERHDRERFEVIAFAFNSASAKDEMRTRLEAAFDQFIDVSQHTDEQVVRLARELGCDIAVDLHGFTHGRRPDIFAMRAAPIQVSYLGYLGTMGAEYMDYLLADTTLIPKEHQTYYSEKIAYLPHSFQVNDSTSRIADKVFARAELGLPEQGFVFCCFNNHYKITPIMFDCWMRLLQRVDGSVLWLLGANNGAEANLRQAALARGVEANRLVFAKRVPMPEYLARHRLADLFLDTQPYNAGATASAALWAGLPVLTYLGDTLSGRMAASLLHAIGLPELIARNLEDYEALALTLATHPEQLAALKQKLATNRLTHPLFDTTLFTQHIESAFQAMFDRNQADLAPDTIYVKAQNTQLAQQIALPQVDENAFSQALSLHQQGRLAAAENLYEAILQAQPEHSDALHFFGVLKHQQGQAQRAVELITHALEINPNNAAAHSNLGLALHALKRFDDAIVSYDHALAIKPNAEAYYNRGNSLLALDRFDAALASYDNALAINPDYIEALSNRGIILRNLNRLDEALSNYEHILAIKPDSAEAEHGCGVILQDLKRFHEAIIRYDRALALKPDLAFIFGTRLYLKRIICDWQGFDDYLAQLINNIERGEQTAIPFSVLAMTSSLAVQKKAAEIYTETQHPSALLLPPIAKHSHAKIKLGYFSADFHRHATAYLMAELFERHDRERFELIAFSFGSVNDKNEMRVRLEAGFDQFHEVSQQSDEYIARLARQLEIDIAIDLKGFTQDYRANIFALRTAPIQVSYLGYPGTMGADYIDYLVADRILIPEAYQPYYTEKIVYLPDSYQVNDSTRVIANKNFTRAELDLPEQGFVFCCFNNNYKITPVVFDSWMRILHHIDNSVLWLLEDNSDVVNNLRREAETRGIAAERLIFAQRMMLPEHLARHRLADLFLDTLPYNAHTTASDALWAGLPVLTCIGEAFASRVAASLLSAVGLPELITTSPEDYEALAIQLATHPEQLAALKQKLAANRLTYPLFDTALFTQHIESAYQTMFDRYQADLAPDHIYVAAHTNNVKLTPIPQNTPDTLQQAISLHQQGQLAAAEALYRQILQTQPQHDRVLHLLGMLANQRGEYQLAVDLIQQALAINPDNAAAYLDMGNALQELQRFDQALASYDRTLSLKPDYAEAFYNRGNLLLDHRHFDKAVMSYDSALSLKPNDATALHNRGIALKNLKRYDEAVSSYSQALAINPDYKFLFGDWLFLKMSICNWDNFDHHLNELEQGIKQGKKISIPFIVLAQSSFASVQKKAAEIYAEDKYPNAPLLPLPLKHAHTKIKIGYFSADFRNHPTTHLIGELFEWHDRSQFELYAFSFSPNEHKDDIRLKLETVFDEFIDISQQSDEQVVRLARQLEIDIAVDLNGYTEHTRTGLFAMRTAPIQVSYLAYPSTMGANYMDYLLADPVLIPSEYQAYYSEKIAYLPNSYQVNNTNRLIADKYFTRAELGLPAQGFVFCCFNNNYKITPAVFDSWMRILHAVKGSVLWLLEDNASAAKNLRSAATARGIDAERICFAQRMTMPEHLARHRAADLFLDTLPYNAHTTASDALWAGLPVLTRMGETFVSRVAASLLNAIGLPELITTNPEDYEALAIQLATHPKQLAAIKQKLANHRLTYPLFDTELFTQHIESAYRLMFDRYQADLAPDTIYVPAHAFSQQPPLVNKATVKNQSKPSESLGLLAKMVQKPAQIFAGITARRKNKSADAQKPADSFTQAEANIFARAQRLHQQGQLAAAEILYEQLLKNQPHHAELLRCLDALKKLHEPTHTHAAASKSLTINNDQILVHLNKGLELQDLNRLHDALDSYDRVLAIDPNHVDALINRGNVLEDLHRLDEALVSYDRAIAAQPDYARAHSNRGNVLQSLKRFDEALASYDKALAIRPDYAEALFNRGNTLQACKRFQEAIVSYDLALAIKPDFVQALVSLGNAQHDCKRSADALISYARALAIQPDYAEALYNRGNVLQDLDRYDEAFDNYDRALSIQPNYAEALSNRGNALGGLTHYDEALASYERVLSIDPDHVGARFNSSFCNLLLGDFDTGWKNYEWRWKTDEFKNAVRHFSQPQWFGKESLRGKTMLLYSEQGLGDTLHFCRYAKQVADLGARVILEVQKPLVGLLANLEGVDLLIARGDALPAFDFYCPLLSLPLAFKTRLESIPADTPYLFSEPDKVKHWQALLGAKTLPRAGIVWTGNTAHKNDRNRSLALQDVLPLLTSDYQFISLQKELRDTDKALLAQQPLLQHYGEQLNDFTDTAALCELMDIIISVDTSVAHLAAAMGKPTWILLPYNPDWRWLLHREDSPWYPTARLFRQSQRGDWQSVLKQVRHELNNQVGRVGSEPVKQSTQPTADTNEAIENLINRGNELEDLGQLQGALASYDNALLLNPDYARAHSNRGNVLQLLNRFEDALAGYDRALAIRPDYPEAFFNRGNALQALNRVDEALTSYNRALAIKPDFVQALISRGNALHDAQRFTEALGSYDDALHITPDNAEVLCNRGNVLIALNRYNDALNNYGRALHIKPDAEFLFGLWLHIKMTLCDWRDFAENVNTLENKIAQHEQVSAPVFVMALSSSPALQKQAAHIYAQAKHPNVLLLPPIAKHAHSKIKIGYFSSDFRHHPLANLTAELFERHDRSRFEVIAFSFSPVSTKDDMRLRLEAGFDQFIDVRQQSDTHIVQLARQLELDIAVDLNGFTVNARPDLFAMRVAPIQVSYLGYVGSMGTSYIDYLLADDVLIPRDYQRYYSEKIAYLPNSFQVSDSTLRIADKAFTRAECGLPEQGVVFCCFNNHYKITPPVFDSWMRILHDVDGSVLWLLADNIGAAENLRREATARGIAAERLCFAQRMAMPEHLARHRVADLFLDTAPFNAGATASTALWAGLPLLTCIGEAFANRMAASLLTAIGLSELITESLTDYEALAIQLATHPEQLAALKQKLAANRLNYPLFDTELFTQHIESAYQAMFERYQADSAPDHIHVSAQVNSAVASAADNTETLFNQGNVLLSQQHFVQALDSYDRALAITPDYLAALCNRGIALQRLKRFDEALGNYDRALAIKPDYADVLTNRGNVLNSLRRFDDALNSYDRALVITPDDVETLTNRGNVLRELKRFDAALAGYDHILSLTPNNADILYSRGIALQALNRWDEALAGYEHALAINSELAFLFGTWLSLKMKMCDWRNFDDSVNKLRQQITQGKACEPFSLQAIALSGALQKKAAEIYTEKQYPSNFLAPALIKHKHQKIRIGYFSSDFRDNHPVGYLTAELFERHDRSRFEVIAFSFSPVSVKDTMRLRLEAAFDEFVDVSQHTDEQVVRLARELGCDIAVNLNGYTAHARTELFALRLAPIQVNYLGYPNTMGAQYMDYLVADSVLIPAEYQAHYTEKVVYLPHSYMVNDTVNRAISDKPMTRSEFGLPEQGIVFCCFNNHYKITPAVFTSWMRILQSVKGSVLWLSSCNAGITSNLRREATAHGVDANRLIFAQRLELSSEHLARHRLADLFLDTTPYNAHTTSSDALWTGLPVVTCMGESFASRVAASLLNAVGLPELITTNLDDYEALAIQLATHPEQLAAIKQKLTANRLTYPLFNTALFTQHIEAAYQTMFDRYQSDSAPDTIYVSGQDHSTSFVLPTLDSVRPEPVEDSNAPHPLIIDIEAVDALINEGNDLEDLGRLNEAITRYERALAINPNYARAHSNRGNVLQLLTRFDDALASYDRALAIRPDYAEAFFNRGNALHALNRFDDALTSYDRALAIKPELVMALIGRGAVLQDLKRFDEALDSYDRALAIHPEYAEAHYNRGNVLQDLKRLHDALASYDCALAIRPDYVEALGNRGSALQDLKRFDEALNSYDRALTIQPDNLDIITRRGIVLQVFNRFDDAISNCEHALALKPDIEFMLGTWLSLKMKQCDWRDFDTHLNTLTEKITRGEKAFTPFFVHSLSSSVAIQQKAAEIYAQAKYPDALLLPAIAKHAHAKIKIGYFSADFRDHPVAYLTAELFERHDRSQFEVIAFSFNASNHKGEMRLRLEAACDQFIDVSQQSDEYVVRLARELEIDIAIDLNGFTDGCRTNIFAMRAAPIQVSYLGYLGTMGADYMDYLLADTTLIPAEHQACYHEKIAYLPHSFQVNDSKLAIANRTFTRAESGLPAQGFVFCCFNNNYKITPTMFAGWMRILQQVEGSVLWLLEDNEAVAANLRREATARGIDAKRLIFAKRLPMPEYLARHRVADLFLDTQPYNAGATASAALWSGLPVLTCLGETFAGRMAASLLKAIGLPELITANLADYEALAIQLATHPEQLAAIKQKLAANRLSYPLFDTALFTRHIEAAYQAMFDRYQSDLAPEPIYVPVSSAESLPSATESYQESEVSPADISLFHQAFESHQQGQLEQAEALYKQLLQTQPRHADALHLLGVIAKQRGQEQAAIDLIGQSLKINPDNAAAHSNIGLSFQALHRFNDALSSYDRALLIQPDYADALFNRGITLQCLKRLDEALTSYDHALTLQPDRAETVFNRGVALQYLKRYDEALISYDRALAIKPDYAEALYSRGIVLSELKRFNEALNSYDRALAIKPDYAEALSNRGVVLNDFKRFDKALDSYNRAISINPDYAEAFFNRGNVLQNLKRYDEALTSYERSLSIKPDVAFSFGTWLHLKMKMCSWHEFNQHIDKLTKGVERGEKIITPFPALAVFSSAAAQKKVSEIYTEANYPGCAFSLPQVKYGHEKIKIGYFSPDFRDHPVAYLTAELFECHDRSRFEIIAFSFSNASDKNDIRLRLEAAFDQFIDVSEQSDEQVMQLAGELEIDIAVDLNGFTEGGRTHLFAMRIAPIQVNYLGYSGTMGAEYMDYLIADSVLIPDEYQTYYTEKVVYLPHSYMVNDTINRPISDKAMTRTEFGLPEQGMVFCCFNNHYKITPAVFASWMRILQRVKGSVLWLSAGDASVVNNLQREATAHGVDANRLIFAQRLASSADHLARHRLADLFLDTLPYNAHTTSSDALWAGLPVLTHIGEAFTSRVAASLLSAVGLPELITTNAEDYEALAIQLAAHPEQLAAIKQKLAANRLTYPLFDTVLFTQHIEAAYQAMFARYQADLAPDHIHVQVQTQSAPIQHTEPSTDNTKKLQQAMSLHQQGQLTAAENLYEEILHSQPQHVDALHFLGVLKNQQGHAQHAVDLITQSLEQYPDNAAAHSNLAMILQALNRFDDALASYDKVLALTPDNADVLLIRGNLLLALNRPVEALTNFDRLLAIKPDAIDALLGHGIILQIFNRFDEALIDYDRILALDAHHAEALFGHANVLYKLKRLDEALISYERSLAINPESVEAFYNQGIVLVDLGRIDEAMTSYQHALAINPDYVEVHNNLGPLLKKQNRYADAEISYQRACTIKPNYIEAHCNLINLLKDQGRISDAKASLNTALTVIPDSLELRFIKLIMTLPMVTKTVAESVLVASQFDDALTDLSNWLASSAMNQENLANAGLLPLPFLLAYRAGNHVQRLSRYGDLVAVTTQQAISAKPVQKKRRMIVVSHHFRRHSVWDVITRGLLVNLDRTRFELILYHLGNIEDQETIFAKSLADQWRDTHTTTDITQWLAAFAVDEPDIIFYPEIGMDPTSARLAAYRLAPLQMASWGHPITTGLPNIDLYFSGELLESPDADSHYRERLIRLPSTGCCTTLFNVTPEPLPELEMQLATRRGTCFIIAQTIYKFDPADDALYADIAGVVGDSTFILLRDRDNAWAMNQIVARLEQTFIDRGLNPNQHLLVISWQSVEKFQSLLDLCDVYLDCPSFSGYTTAWQAVHRGLPIVTLEGEFMRQRLAAGLLRKIGLTDTIASSREQYIQLAAKLAAECRNPIVRNARRQALKTAAPKADNDVSVVRAFEQTVINALAERVL